MLYCPCGQPDCWGFYVGIELHEDYVIWSDYFHNFASRYPERYRGWNYSALRNFVFDRREYEAALGALI